MPYPTPPVPGTVVPSGSLITPSGTMGAQGPIGPTGVSANAGNLAQLGTDNLVLVPQNNIQGLSKYYGLDTGTASALVVNVNSDFRLVSGVVVWVVPANNCGASPTLNVNSTGAIPIVNRASIAISSQEIAQGKMIGVVYDGSSWRVITPLIRFYSASNPGTVTIECAGYDGVSVFLILSNGSALALTFAHLAPGMPVNLKAGSSFTGSVNYTIAATNVAGTAMGVYWIFCNAITGVNIINLGTAQSLTTNLSLLFVGFVDSTGELAFL